MNKRPTPRFDAPAHTRRAERVPVSVPGRLTWKDDRGVQRFASVTTRDVSEEGVYLDCRSGETIPLYRLVYLQIEREGRVSDELPTTLRDGRVLSAVYRVGPCQPSTGAPSGYALRLLVDPRALAGSMRKAEERSIA